MKREGHEASRVTVNATCCTLQFAVDRLWGSYLRMISAL